jgi:CRP-like cAMP-binding protein
MEVPYRQFQKAIQALYPTFPEEAWAYIHSISSMKSYDKKAYLINHNEIQQYISFIISGLVRGYYINDKGEEITIRFARENGYVTHYTALLAQQPSQYYFQCLEPTIVVQLPFSKIQEGYSKYKGLERFGRLIAEQILQSQQKRIESFQFLNAEQRYLSFVQDYPTLFNRVSLSHLSSYLGIQRPSLSRIRKNLIQPK